MKKEINFCAKKKKKFDFDFVFVFDDLLFFIYLIASKIAFFFIFIFFFFANKISSMKSSIVNDHFFFLEVNLSSPYWSELMPMEVEDNH
jgi:hypothetical protein